MAELAVTKQDVQEIVGEAVEELARITAEGFTEVHSKLDEQHDENDKRFTKIEDSQAEQSERLSDLAAGQDRIEKKVDGVTGYHEEEIQRGLKHIKLKPLKASE